MSPMISKYFWLIMIVVMLINIPFFKLRVRDEIKKYPFREYQYDKLIVGLTFYVILSCCVMGIAAIFGNIDFMSEMDRPSWNFFTILLQATTILEATSFFIWIWFFNGAKFLAKYGKVFNLPRWPVLMKIIAAGLVVWSIFPIFVR